MITIDNVQYRNLTEQVQKNKSDIAELKDIDIFIDGLGIRVQGRLDTVDELPDAETMGENYGYAYLVGTESPYELYVWTRANPDAGHDEPYFLNLGDMSIVGPEGPQGEQGEKGETGTRGTKLTTVLAVPSSTSGYIEGDSILIIGAAGKGNIYTLTGGQFVLNTNIMGPQGIDGAQGETGPQGNPGPQGPQGLKGDVGGFINIMGTLASADQLPDPATLRDLTKAFLVGDDHDLYIQVGPDSDTAVWENEGQLNVGTYVTVNGEFQNVYEMNSKLDVNSTEGYKVYGHMGATQLQIPLANSVDANTIAVRTNGGQVKVANPSLDVDAANKGYVDNNLPKVIRL